MVPAIYPFAALVLTTSLSISPAPQPIPLLNRQKRQGNRKPLMPRHALGPVEPIRHAPLPPAILRLQPQQPLQIPLVQDAAPRRRDDPARERQRVAVGLGPLQHAVPQHGPEATAEVVRRLPQEAGDEVEEEVRGRVVVGAVPEGAVDEDVVEPVLRGGELVAAAELVEEGEAVDAHEGVDADLVVREVPLQDALRIDVFEHLIHDALSVCVLEVVEGRVSDGVAIDVDGELFEAVWHGTVVPTEKTLVRVEVDEGLVARGVQNAVLHIGVLDGDAEACFEIELARSVLQPTFCSSNGFAADLPNALDALLDVTAHDAIETERARSYHVVDVAADVEASRGIQSGRCKGFCEYCRMR